jgi:hypothetical protein
VSNRNCNELTIENMHSLLEQGVNKEGLFVMDIGLSYFKQYFACDHARCYPTHLLRA